MTNKNIINKIKILKVEILMKIVELLEKVETLSTQEIDELADNGIEIEDVQYLLFNGSNDIKIILFRNEKIKTIFINAIEFICS